MTPALPPEALLAEAADMLADGKAETAVDLCRQAIEANPDSASAYALLGMAEEERGALGAAFEAYERALELDPERPNEAQKIAELRQRLLEESVQDEVAEDRRRRRAAFYERYAPVFISAGVGIFVLVVLVSLILHVRYARHLAATEAEYTTLMNQGQSYVTVGNPDEAAVCFQRALELRPNDPEASKWAAYVQGQAQKDAQLAQLNQATAQGQWIPPGENLFQSTPLGNVPQGTGQIVSPAPEPVFPDVTGPSRRRTPDYNAVSPSKTDGGYMGNADVPPPTTPATDVGQPAVSPLPEQPATPAPRGPRGEITITVGDTPAPASATPQPSHSGSEAEALRRHADALRAQGRGREAADTYRQAIQKTQESSESSALKNQSIESMRRAIGLIESSEH
jgi:tetratricopeptide (TPR) repeat protein